MLRQFTALLLFVLAGAAALCAQTPDTATLQGTVFDPAHEAVAGARVTATNASDGLKFAAVSGADGRFTLAALPVSGSYTITVDKPGFATARIDREQLSPGSTAVLTLVLKIEGQTSVITVEGAAGDIRVDQPQLGIALNQEQMQQTPLLSRRITGLPLLNAANRPAINQGDIFMNEWLINTNGAGRRQPWFEIDGANGIDMWGRQTIFTNIPLMAVDQMTVLTNAFSAEYGGGVGSVVNLVTRSGGNDYHGNLLELWRPAATEASLAGFTSGTATSGNDIASDVLGQTALAFSGPLASRNTHFFTAGEWNREAKASPVTSPLAPGSFVGHYRGWLGLVRLDQRLNASNNAFLRANFDAFTDTNPNGIVGGATLPSVARTFHRRTYAAELGESATLTPHLVNNLRAQFQLASPITEFDPVVYGTQFVVPISSGGTFTSGTSQNALLMNRQYELAETVAFDRGRHQIATGADFLYAHNGGNSKEFGGPIFLGKFTYNTCTASAAVCESPSYLNDISNVANYQQSFGNAQYTVDDAFAAAFIQDDYRATRRLTVNLGLRYERQGFTDSTLDFAPRIGFVVDLTGSGNTVFRAGYGIYDSQIVDNSAASYALGEPSGVFTFTAAPGQIGFPASVSDAPLPAFPPGAPVPVRSLYVRPGQPQYLAQWFPPSVLKGYPARLLNPYSEQYTASLERRLAPNWTLTVDYVGTHTLRIQRPLDVDPPTSFVRTAQGQTRTAQAANCTRPYWVYWYNANGMTCSTTKATNPQPPYSVIQTDVNDGYLHYNALDVNLAHSFTSGFQFLLSYAWSHTLDNVDPDTTAQNPNDPNFTGHTEYGPAIFDQRNRLVVSGSYLVPYLRAHLGGVGSFAGGMPYNIVTGTNNSGDTGATTDRPVINGAVIGRNAGRGNPQYSVDPFLSRAFPLPRDRASINLRAEAFNLLNHANFVSYSGTYGNGPAPGTGFGAPLAGVTAQLPARSVQFSAELTF